MAVPKKRSSYPPTIKSSGSRKATDSRHSTASLIEELSEPLLSSSHSTYSETDENSMGNDDIHDILSILQTKFRKKTHDQQKTIQNEVQTTLQNVSKLVLEQINALDKESEVKIRTHRNFVEDLQSQHGTLLKNLQDEHEKSLESLKSKILKLETMQRKMEESHKTLQADLESLKSKRKAQVMQGMEKLQKESALLKQRLSVKVAHKNQKYKNIRQVDRHEPYEWHSTVLDRRTPTLCSM